MSSSPIPHLTRAQSRRVDEVASSNFAIPMLLLMENAARSAATVAWKMLNGKPARVVLLAGPGNNGGDALAVARHLHNRGCSVICALLSPADTFKGDAAVMLKIIEAMQLPTPPASPELLNNADLIVDGLFGTGLTRPLEGLARDLALATHNTSTPVLSLDLPSGLDADTGEPLGTAVKAHTTVTFVTPKAAFKNPASRAYTGQIVIGDIGVPPEVVDQVLKG